MHKEKTIVRQKIGVFHLAMITIAYVATVRTMAMMAKYGFSCLFLYLIGTLFFLLPLALVSAELATSLPSKGGIYTWVGEAIPGPFGFLAVWLQLLAGVVGLPVLLSFLAATFAFAISPALASSPFYQIIFIVIVVWIGVFGSCFGMKTVGWINTIGVIFGLLLPMALIVVLTITWITSGNPICIEVSPRALFPKFDNFYSLVFMAGLLYSFTGIEASGPHALDLKDIRKDYPKAMLITAAVVFAVGMGGLAIAFVVPKDHISLVSGLMEAFTAFFSRFHLQWLVPVVALSIVLGYLGALNSNFVGPGKGMYGTARQGEIPPFLSKENKHGMPANMFCFMGLIATILCCAFFFMPNVEAGYLFILDSVTALYMFMYSLLFLSGIILRFKRPDLPRPYKVFGGNIGMIIIAGIGFLTSTLGILVSFIPPPSLSGIKEIIYYEVWMFICVGILIGLGLFFYVNRRKEWINEKVK